MSSVKMSHHPVYHWVCVFPSHCPADILYTLIICPLLHAARCACLIYCDLITIMIVGEVYTTRMSAHFSVLSDLQVVMVVICGTLLLYAVVNISCYKF